MIGHCNTVNDDTIEKIADKENVEYSREDILACLKGETPENKAASVEEIYAGINY